MARLGNLLTASATADPERSRCWSVPRPFIRLYLVLFTIQAGWLLSIIVRDVLANHISGNWETIAYETLRGLSQPGVGVAITSLLVVEGISYVMVMYNLWMDLLVRPIVKWHERRGEARGIAIGEARGVARGELLAKLASHNSGKSGTAAVLTPRREARRLPNRPLLVNQRISPRRPPLLRDPAAVDD